MCVYVCACSIKLPASVGPVRLPDPLKVYSCTYIRRYRVRESESGREKQRRQGKRREEKKVKKMSTEAEREGHAVSETSTSN